MGKGMTHAEIMASFTAEFVDKGRAVYKPATDSWFLDGDPATALGLRNAVVFELERASASKTAVVLDRKAKQLQVEERDRVVAWAQQPAGDDKELRKWVCLMQREGTLNAAHEAHVWALKQWMWQVKRHILGRLVTWHVLPIFYSRENGTGKSFNVKRFFSPLKSFTRTLNVSDLNDRFGAQLFARTYVAFFDEFAGAEGVDLGIFKSIVTGRPLEGRMMYSESGYHAPNRISFLATSNRQPPHGLEDESGARRLWSIHCSAEPADAGNARGQALDAIDMEAVWASVDVEWSSVQAQVPAEVAEYMEVSREEQLRIPDSFEAFCEEHLERGAPQDRTRMRTIVRAYRDWCRETNHIQVAAGQAKLAVRLKALGFEVVNCKNRRFLVAFGLRGEPLNEAENP